MPEGSVFALLGPNGAGKTTTVDILSTLSRADAGAVCVGGHDVARDPESVRAAIAVTGQFSAVDDLLTGEENLRLMADLRHLGRDEGRRRDRRPAGALRPRPRRRDKPVATYSGGMRRKLDLAMGLVGDPRIVFLDEPTTGLDPRSRRTMWDIVRGLVADGVTIFLTTQYLEEADQLADRIGGARRRPAGRRGHRRRAQAARPRRPLRLTFRDPARTRLRGRRAARARPPRTDDAQPRGAQRRQPAVAALGARHAGRRVRSTRST